MSVESYLDSIRKNTIRNSEKSSALNETMKDLLNYESLKKAVSDGVAKGNKEQFKRLSELSKKILTSSDATHAEIRETNQLLKLFYAQIPKNASGSTSVSVESWVKALKDVLDEFGDRLPEKFQKRLKYDIVSTAARGGADPKMVMQQLNIQNNQTINQTIVIQNILDYMKDKDQQIERDAEARKPIENNEKKEQATFWQTRLGRVINTLTDILGKIGQVGKWLGLIYVGYGIWQQLAPEIQTALRSIGAFLGGKELLKLGSLLKDPAWIKNFKNFGSKIGSSLAPILNKFSAKFKSTKLGSALTPLLDKFSASIKSLGSFGSAKLPGISGNMSNLAKIEAFFLKIKAIATHAIKEAVPGIKLALKEAFPTVTKVINWFKKFGQGVSSVYSKAKPIFSAVGSWMGKLLSGAKTILPKLKPLMALLKGGVKAIPIFGWAIQAIISLFDFITGFINTNGSFMDKVKGGLKRAATEFVAVFGDLFVWVVSGLKKLLLKMVPSKIPEDGLNPWQTMALKGAGALANVEKSIKSGLSSMRSGAGYENTAGNSSGSSTAQVYEPATNTVYTGKDIISHATPLASHISGTTPATAEGINKAAGVRMSSQTADFYKRAGLTDVVTSGIRDPGSRDIKNGQISQRSHASGNKFDIAGRTATGQLKNAQQLADSLAKMIKTPGLLEAHVEGPKSWYSTYARAVELLKKQGLDTSKVGWWGDTYSSQPHIDVLIDPKYSGVPSTSADNLTASIDGAANTGEKEQVNPLVAQMQAQITQAYNESIKLFDKGAKAPDQLASNDNKAVVSAISNQAASKSGGNSLSFKMQNDITDAQLAAQYMFNLG